MITQKYLLECFDIDFNTGRIAWKKRPLEHFKNTAGQNIFNGNYAGKEVTYKSTNGYRQVRIFGVMTGIHRIIYQAFHGDCPAMLDHINGDKDDNRIQNLRACTKSQNAFNSKIRMDSTTGIRGVHLYKRTGKYQAYSNVNGKRKCLGTFETAEQAEQAVKDYSLKTQEAFYRSIL